MVTLGTGVIGQTKIGQIWTTIKEKKIQDIIAKPKASTSVQTNSNHIAANPKSKKNKTKVKTQI